VIYILFLYTFLGLNKLYIKISSIHKKKIDLHHKSIFLFLYFDLKINADL